MITHKNQRIPFAQFRSYCLQVQHTLNQIEQFQATYKISSHPLLKQHDGQYLQIKHQNNQHLIKINLLYSIAYEIPLFYFIIYNSESQPLSAEQIYEQFIHKNQKEHEELHPKNEQKGIFLSQNPINKQYYFTLHHCDIALKINYLIPFYLSIIGLHPHLNIDFNRQT